MNLEDVKLRSMSARQALAADAVLTRENPYDPDEFAEHCCRVVAAMVLDDSGINERWTLAEVRELPDGIAQELFPRCQEQRMRDQVNAKKNFGQPSEDTPVVSLECLAGQTSTDSLVRSAKPSTSNGEASLHPTTSSSMSSQTKPAEVA